MFHEKQLPCPASHAMLELSQSHAASLFSHQCSRGGTGYHSYSTILKIVLNTRSFPERYSLAFALLVQGEKERKSERRAAVRLPLSAMAWGVGRSAALKIPVDSSGIFCARHPNPQRIYNLLLYSCLSDLPPAWPDAECPKQIPPLNPPLLCACNCRAVAQER